MLQHSHHFFKTAECPISRSLATKYISPKKLLEIFSSDQYHLGYTDTYEISEPKVSIIPEIQFCGVSAKMTTYPTQNQALRDPVILERFVPNTKQEPKLGL